MRTKRFLNRFKVLTSSKMNKALLILVPLTIIVMVGVAFALNLTPKKTEPTSFVDTAKSSQSKTTGSSDKKTTTSKSEIEEVVAKEKEQDNSQFSPVTEKVLSTTTEEIGSIGKGNLEQATQNETQASVASTEQTSSDIAEEQRKAQEVQRELNRQRAEALKEEYEAKGYTVNIIEE